MRDNDIKHELEKSEQFRDLTFSKSSSKTVTKKAYIQHLIHDIFIGLSTLILLFVYMVTIHSDYVARYVPELLRLILLVGIIFIFFKASKKLSEWLLKFPYSSIIQLVINCLIILYFIYQAFAPYFYSDEYLIEHGMEKVELSYIFDDEDLRMDEREELASEIYISEMAFAFLSMYEFQENLPDQTLVDYEVLEIERTFNYYKLDVKITQEIKGDLDTGVMTFTFSKENGVFKLRGHTYN